jgi:hypothetical protein
VFVHGRLYQPTLMLISKTRCLPSSGAPEALHKAREAGTNTLADHKLVQSFVALVNGPIL